jgi:hypothetical protein
MSIEIAMNKRARQLIDKSCKDIGLVWTGDALPASIIRNVIVDIDNELGKIKWVGADESWNLAVEKIREELREIYE